jgi:hypothetical protein
MLYLWARMNKDPLQSGLAIISIFVGDRLVVDDFARYSVLRLIHDESIG